MDLYFKMLENTYSIHTYQKFIVSDHIPSTCDAPPEIDTCDELEELFTNNFDEEAMKSICYTPWVVFLKTCDNLTESLIRDNCRSMCERFTESGIEIGYLCIIC